MDAAALALLGVVVAVLLWRATTRGRRDYARFKRLRSTVARQQVYRRWVIEGALANGGLSLATIVGACSSIPVVLADAQASAPVAAVRAFFGQPYGLPVAIGVAVVLLAGMVLPVVLLRDSPDEAPAVGDIRALLPRTRGELRYGAALSLNAGVFEELLFRLGLPALIFAVSGNTLVAFLGAIVLFALLHVYQGAFGILFSALLGAVFTLLYLVTGSIVVPIVVHALVDLRSLVLIPVVLGKAAAKP